MATELETLSGQLTEKRNRLADLFDKHKTTVDGKAAYDFTNEQVDEVRTLNAELADLGTKYQKLRDQEQYTLWEKNNQEAIAALNTPLLPGGGYMPGGGGGARGWDGAYQRPQTKSLGQLVVDSPEYKKSLETVKSGGRFHPVDVTIPDFDLKTVMTETGTGFAPPNYRTNIVIFSAQRRPMVADLIPQDPTNLQVVKYMLETTYTNNSAMTSEGGSAANNVLGYTEQTVTVEWLPAYIPVTEQQLEDVPQINGILNNRLTLMLYQQEETELLSGSGSSPHLKGFLNVSGVQTQALGSDPAPDAVHKAMTLIRYTGWADPSGMVMHPSDWQGIRLLRTSIGTYLFGNPDTPGQFVIWGMPVVVTPAISQGTALIGDFMMYSHISRRLGLRIEVGYINDDFIKGQKTIRAQERLCLEVYRPAAFCTVTGLQADA